VLRRKFAFVRIFAYTDGCMLRQTNTKDSITLSKMEYSRLRNQARAYRSLASKVFELPLRDPIGEVAEDFRTMGLYSEDFLRDLESGLRKSTYAKRHSH